MDGVFTPTLSWPFLKPSKGVGLHDNLKAGESKIEDHLDKNFRNMQAEVEGLPFWQELDYDVDLMVDNPAKAVDEWVKVGVSRVILHAREHNLNDITVAIEVAKSVNVDVSIAILPGLVSDRMMDFIFKKHLQDISGIQCMGIEEVGYQGHPLSPKVFETIKQILLALDTHNAEVTKSGEGSYKTLEISVDGGVNHEHARPLYDAGVDKLVVGSAIFSSDSPRQSIEFFSDILMN
jgi:ribulose-phosphate 3-epimerase